MLEKHYQPNEVEDRIYKAWLDAGAFDSGRPERKDAEAYCIVIPPPNVTGSLHMGHALNNTLQDILCRFERMRGKDVLWQVGTDHAGIATQMVVERQLAERKEPGRRDMGRDAFVKRVWDWKEESGGTIIKQLKKLGASCDWRRERFTMDDGLSKAVLEVFVTLHKEGLIYRDKRLVNWDPVLLTAVSDLEVQQIECRGNFNWSRKSDTPLEATALSKALKRNPNGHLYYFDYPLADEPERFITVATTRPETMLGDRAVAVHPEDDRYRNLIGKYVRLPLVSSTHPVYSNLIPIISDEYSDPTKGTGAVKITPAHDFNDFEVGKRHGLEFLNILTAEGRIVAPPAQGSLAQGLSEGDFIPERLRNLDRFDARIAVVEMMHEAGLLQKVESHVHAVPHGDRSGAVLEPRLTDQWYVDAKKLAADALTAVKSGKTVFVPKTWEKTYFDWLENIQPWCISRQLWWGHQIPVWYGPKKGASNFEFGPWETFVAKSENEAIAQARDYYGREVQVVSGETGVLAVWSQAASAPATPIEAMPIWRDPDVLDTWFSSALWPFSTLGWPDKTKELERYYPTQVLVTGFDIIFFWVARMMMMGLHFKKEVPFHTVYIHALVRDERGAKMSKSKGNVIDPLHLIDDYGADALRFTLAAMAAQGRDIKLSTQRVEGYRNFATKLWNAARFAEMNGAQRVSFDPKSAKETLNQWILGEAAATAKEVTGAIEAYKFNDAANAVYRFVWSVYCDWYVELTKPVLTGPDNPAKDETRATAAFVLDEILKLLHPFMPFLTEELWGLTGENGPKRESLLALSAWPKLEGLENEKAASEMRWAIDLVEAIRSVRSELNIASSVKIPIVLQTRITNFERLQRWREPLMRLARVSSIQAFSPESPKLWKKILHHFYFTWWRPNDFWKWQKVHIPTLRGAIQIILGDDIVFLPLGGVVDFSAERTRLEKELAKVDADIERVDKKLGNPKFVEHADEEVVEGEREKREEAIGRRAKILEAVERLKGAA